MNSTLLNPVDNLAIKDSMLLSERYTSEANALIKSAYESDSMTNWAQLKLLKEKAFEAALDEIILFKSKLIQLLDHTNQQHDLNLKLSYIGNCSFDGRYDDRGWFISAPHPQRIGKSTDSFGMHETAKLKDLLKLCETGLLPWALNHKEVNNY
jgi:hypothetical protein